MKLLLDTHALIWWLAGSASLSSRAAEMMRMEEAQIFVSAVNALEVATKFRIGKLPSAEYLALNFEREVLRQGFRSLSISVEHARLAGGMKNDHRDPFDRLLIAQAKTEDMLLVSCEKMFDEFGVRRCW